MIDTRCTNLLKIVANLQDDLVVIFNGTEPILTNHTFNKFFGVSSFEEYQSNYGVFINNFVPHPSYFNQEKIGEGETWFESILKLDEIDRVVSMLSAKHDPHAFSVEINMSEEEYVVVRLKDITQDLVKRIMIENNASVDKKSGAYSKQYFLQITKSYEEAAVFNEKIIGLCSFEIYNDDIGEGAAKEFADSIKSTIREDDMLIHWSHNKFLLLFMIENKEKAAQVTNKLKSSISSGGLAKFNAESSSVVQENSEHISALINKLQL